MSRHSGVQSIENGPRTRTRGFTREHPAQGVVPANDMMPKRTSNMQDKQSSERPSEERVGFNEDMFDRSVRADEPGQREKAEYRCRYVQGRGRSCAPSDQGQCAKTDIETGMHSGGQPMFMRLKARRQDRPLDRDQPPA